ncbi:serine hydrolase domain-containing protein [Allomuricauda sp. SCSIO 65647]|uniref:serine hydrolase domain-containing protein n=1 Tax=Allomuricauda sp. SCSIO 65647 TaxID=2908843 RepID=UPI001F47F765|nr:serine hydrolase [Muricauda sp. SCSIO 65647]UJH67444.1 beta-lactamase family protein [Muricauda sp. SCSIO 65647]
MLNFIHLLQFKNIVFLFFLAMIQIGCISKTSSQFHYRPPEELSDGLTVGSLEEVGLDSILISEVTRKIQKGSFGEIHSLLLIKNNKLVFEEYFEGHKYQWDAPDYLGESIVWDGTMLHDTKSVTKSITALCIGIAIEKGFIKSVHQSIFDFLPKHQHLKTEKKEKITIEHLLTMTSGLAWNEWEAPYSSKDNPMIGIWFSEKNPITYILEAPMLSTPGTKFSYFGGSHVLLGEILKNATSMSIEVFAKQYLFKPLGIENANWSIKYKNDIYEAAGSLELTPRAMAKIGLTFLNDGSWGKKQVVSDDWIKKSSAQFRNNTGIEIPGEDLGKSGYSYSWWVDSFSVNGKSINLHHALGWGGQKIVVIPEYDMVFVSTGGNYNSRVRQFKIIKKYILPAVE